MHLEENENENCQKFPTLCDVSYHAWLKAKQRKNKTDAYEEKGKENEMKSVQCSRKININI